MHALRLAAAGLALALAAPGCSTVTPFSTAPAVANAVPNFSSGRAVQAFPAADDLVDRSQLAMEDVGVHSILRRKEDRATVLDGKTAAGRRAVVSLQPEGTSTVVSARFGTLGDEALSRAFLDRLAARAGTPTTRDDQPATTRRPTPNRASAMPGSILQNQLEGGYRDSVSP